MGGGAGGGPVDPVETLWGWDEDFGGPKDAGTNSTVTHGGQLVNKWQVAAFFLLGNPPLPIGQEKL